MDERSDIQLLVAAIDNVARSDQSRAKLARAAVTRPNCEGEWVYEIDGSPALLDLEPRDVAREVSFGQRRRADLRIRRTLVEFKSTKPWYAETKDLVITEPGVPPRKGSAQAWLGPDIIRMAKVSQSAAQGGIKLKGGVTATAGVFVLLVSADGEVGRGEFKGLSCGDGRLLGIDRYRKWLEVYTASYAPGAAVTLVPAGRGRYRDAEVVHDALIVHWPSGTEPAS
jgi:hypothetical protein